MDEMIELDPVDALRAGAVGRPGQRAFYIQADKESARVTVLVEKEQVALLATEAVAFLDRVAERHPEPTERRLRIADAEVSEPAEPLFRARSIGIGFDADREMVVIELREYGEDDEQEDEQGDEQGEGGDERGVEGDERGGWIARLFATRDQVRAMAAAGTVAVSSGRPPCPLCEMPMDPDGHICPRWN